MTKHLFIDTNVYLRIFNKTADTITQVKLLIKLIEHGHIKLYTTEQILEEYSRNVEREIEDAIQDIKKIPDQIELPRVAQQFDHASNIMEAYKTIQSAKKELLTDAQEAIDTSQIEADKLIIKIFESAQEIKRTDQIIDAARLRRDLGNPPGKKDSLGDQINWQCLLNGVPDNQSLAIISRDGDFTLKAGNIKIKNFLLKEWKDKKTSDLVLFHDLKSYLSSEFPEYKNANMVEKSVAIEKLKLSTTFFNTHEQIANLEAVYNDIKFEDAIEIFQALVDNNQINWIASDQNIKDFYIKLYNSYSRKTDEDLDEKLYVAASYLKPELPAFDDLDDDVPF